MLLRCAMIVWAMAVTALPVDAVYSASTTPAAPSAPIENSTPGPEPAPSVPTEGLQFDAKPVGLTYKVDVPAAAPWSGDFRFDFAHPQPSVAATRLSPVVNTTRTGWAFSGRVGPLRWLSPIDGEGETKMRLWGRVPEQPRTPGMGNFNVGLHYTFE